MRFGSKAFLRICLLALLGVSICIFIALQSFQSEKSVEIGDAWVRSFLTSGSMTAGYCTIFNQMDEDIVIVSAHAEQVGAIEFHESTYQDEMHRMVKLDQLHIPAGKKLHLEPGGKHLMLFDVERNGSTTYQIEFVLGDGTNVAHDFAVEDRTM